jgi:hypothetical protein
MIDRRRSIQGAQVLCGLLVSLAVTLWIVALPAAPSLQHELGDAGKTAGTSVHAKNSATPGWILELQTSDAAQPPVPVRSDEPSFWI